MLGDSVDGFAYDLVAVGRQVLSDRFNSVRASFAKAVGGGLGRGGIPQDLVIGAHAAAKWHCVHFTSSDGDKCKGLKGAEQLACQTKVCRTKDGNFSHDADHNAMFPGCGTCWCCAAAAGPPSPGPPPPPPPPADPKTAKRLGAELLQLIDDMDELLCSHHAFLLGTWLQDAEGWADQASTPAHGALLMQGARRVITLWGHPDSKTDRHNSGLSQYSYRLWAGLVREFYRPRWAAFVDAVVETISAGKAFDKTAQAQLTQTLTWWEEAWVNNASNTAASFGTVSTGSSTTIASKLCGKYVPGCELGYMHGDLMELEGNGVAQAGHSLRGLQIVETQLTTAPLKADDGAAQLPVRTCEPGSPSSVKVCGPGLQFGTPDAVATC